MRAVTRHSSGQRFHPADRVELFQERLDRFERLRGRCIVAARDRDQAQQRQLGPLAGRGVVARFELDRFDARGQLVELAQGPGGLHELDRRRTELAAGLRRAARLAAARRRRGRRCFRRAERRCRERRAEVALEPPDGTIGRREHPGGEQLDTLLGGQRAGFSSTSPASRAKNDSPITSCRARRSASESGAMAGRGRSGWPVAPASALAGHRPRSTTLRDLRGGLVLVVEQAELAAESRLERPLVDRSGR